MHNFFLHKNILIFRRFFNSANRLLNINIHFCEIFLAENFVISIIIRIFAASVLAKPLNNAQIVRGVFYLYTFEYGKSYTFYKTI